MEIEARDRRLITGMRKIREAALAVELEGLAARARDVAVEGLQLRLVALDEALRREEFEGIEARESQQLFVERRDALLERLEALYGAISSAPAPSPRELADMQQFFTEQPLGALTSRGGEELERCTELAAALARRVLDDEHHAQLIVPAERQAERMLEAWRDFEREDSEFVEAQQQLEETRQGAYVAVLNARDLMRAALRSYDMLHELDAVAPTLGDILEGA